MADAFAALAAFLVSSMSTTQDDYALAAPSE